VWDEHMRYRQRKRTAERERKRRGEEGDKGRKALAGRTWTARHLEVSFGVSGSREGVGGRIDLVWAESGSLGRTDDGSKEREVSGDRKGWVWMMRWPVERGRRRWRSRRDEDVGEGRKERIVGC
jgi:hypothetical protein